MCGKSVATFSDPTDVRFAVASLSAWISAGPVAGRPPCEAWMFASLEAAGATFHS